MTRPYCCPFQWSCNASCPKEQPYEYSESQSGDSVCNVQSESVVANELRRRSIIISCVVPAVIILIIAAIIVVCCVLRQRDIARKEHIRLKVSEHEPMKLSFNFEFRKPALRISECLNSNLQLQAKFAGALRDEEREPLNSEDGRPAVPPDQSHLRIIRDSELERGPIIGSGAFGTVYRCKWNPPPDPNDTQKVRHRVFSFVLTKVSKQQEMRLTAFYC